MRSKFFFLARVVAIAVFVLAAPLSYAKEGNTEVESSPVFHVEGLGKGTVPLKGPWQFHSGDNPKWSDPAFDASGWEQISAERPWGAQGHASYTGFAWYRTSLALSPAPGVPAQFSLLIPRIENAYEVYWNGVLIGRNGKLPPHPVWYIAQSPQTFELSGAQRGVLAIRVWKAPLLSDDSGKSGGFRTAPTIGSSDAIVTVKAALDYQWLRSRQFLFGENLLCSLVALLSFLLWVRNPSRGLLFWMTGFAIIPPMNLLLLNAHIRWPYVFAMGAAQPLAALRDISLWFLLLWLLPLQENRFLSGLTRVLACVGLANGSLDGLLVSISWSPKWIGFVQTADAASAVIGTLLEAFPLVLAGYALFYSKRLDSARWLVAVSAFLDEMILVLRNTVKQGRQFTDWSFASTIDAPLFTLGGSAISVYTLTSALLLVAIVYAVYSAVLDDQRRQDALEREKRELVRESTRMRHHAEHDGLTGLWNHRIIVERLDGEMSRSRRDGSSLSVVLIDIDHFKRINDTYGHPAGDLVLKEISSIFMRSLRSYDSVGRYGGEEFLLILPGCGLEDALNRAEELRQAVESERIIDGETIIRVTASFGVASDFTADHEAEAVIRTVDAALYRAKSNGRNCVAPAEGSAPLCET